MKRGLTGLLQQDGKESRKRKTEKKDETESWTRDRQETDKKQTRIKNSWQQMP